MCLRVAPPPGRGAGVEMRGIVGSRIGLACHMAEHMALVTGAGARCGVCLFMLTKSRLTCTGANDGHYVQSLSVHTLPAVLEVIASSEVVL